MSIVTSVSFNPNVRVDAGLRVEGGHGMKNMTEDIFKFTRSFLMGI